MSLVHGLCIPLCCYSNPLLLSTHSPLSSQMAEIHSSSSDSDDNSSSISLKFRRLFGREKSLHKLMGGGKLADVMLWRNKKASAITLTVATGIWVLFECMEYHLLTFTSHVLILSILTMFIWTKAANLMKRTPPRIPEIRFSEEIFLNTASAMRVEVNRFFALLHDVSGGKDLKALVLALGILWIVSAVGSWTNFLTLMYMAFVVLQTVPVLYENHEDKIDKWTHLASVGIRKQYRAFDNAVLNRIPRGPQVNFKKLK